MYLFLATYCAIYGSMHAYVFHKIHRAFPRLGYWSIPVLVFFAAAVFAPIAVRLLDNAGHARLALLASPATHSWIAVVFWFCVLALLTDGWNVAARLISAPVPAAGKLVIPPRLALGASAVLIAAACAWGVVEAANTRVVRLTIRCRTLPAGSKPLTIVQIADTHMGLFMREKRLARIVERIQELRPDVLVSTGDLLDSSFHEPELAKLLVGIEPPLGKYAVTGNHEFYAGLDNSLAFHKAAGFKVLRQEWVAVGDRLRIAGVDDPAGLGRALLDEAKALPDSTPGIVTVLLKHRPQVDDASLGRFDLQLSGHSHGGQIFPYGLVLRFINQYGPGLHYLEGGPAIYVSRGSGTWGPPMRLLAPPEITMITIEAGGE